MSVHMRKSGSVFVRYREGGKQKQKSFGSGKKAIVEARKFDRSVAEKKKQEEEQPLFAAVQSVTYVSELVDLYYGMEDESERKNWKNDWLKLFKKHVLPGLAQVPIDQLTQDGLVRLMRKAFPDASLVTRTTYLSYMKTMFNWALSREYIEKNPLAFVTRKYSPQKDFLLTKEQLMRIRDAAPSHTAFGIEFIANTGVRPGPSELLSLQWKHVDWNKSSIKVFAEKTQRWRTIPVKADFLDKLLAQKQKAKSKYIIEYNGRKVKSLHQAFRRACKRANVGKGVVLYDIRHWYCTTLLSKGVPVKTVATLMGHSSAKLTLDIYSHFIPSDADKAITVLPDLG